MERLAKGTVFCIPPPFAGPVCQKSLSEMLTQTRSAMRSPRSADVVCDLIDGSVACFGDDRVTHAVGNPGAGVDRTVGSVLAPGMQLRRHWPQQQAQPCAGRFLIHEQCRR